MTSKIVKAYNDQPHFGDSSRDSFFEAIVNENIKITFVRCDDKHSRNLGNVIILSVNENIMNPSQTLQDLGLDEDQLIESLIDAADRF